jgi:predicted Fe-Mo cluster-binding NifX family protein
MQFHERELLVNRILSGKQYYRGLTIVSPSIDIQYQASIVYSQSLEDSHDLMSREECESLSIYKGFLSEKEFDSVESLSKDVENFQVELYLNRSKSNEKEKIASYIKKARNEQIRVLNLAGKYDQYSSEGYASFCKINFLLRKTTYLNKKPYRFKSIRIEELVRHYTNNILLPNTIRKLARTNPWINRWSAFKSNGIIFPEGYNITEPQQLLLMWSSFYDSVNESPDKPEQFVIDNDDMLDGWLVLQRDKENKENKSEPVTRNSKIAKAQEVYIVANNIDEVKNIENMNSPSSRNVRKQRFQKVMKEGTVNHMDMPDVKNEYIQQATRALKEQYVKRSK